MGNLLVQKAKYVAMMMSQSPPDLASAAYEQKWKDELVLQCDNDMSSGDGFGLTKMTGFTDQRGTFTQAAQQTPVATPTPQKPKAAKGRKKQAIEPNSFMNMPMEDDLNDNEASGAGRIKKDTLWKPMLREFRCHWRTRLNQVLDFSKIKDDSTGEAIRQLEQNCRDLLIDINAAPHIVENRLNLHALIILAMPATSKKMEKYLTWLPDVRNNLPRLLNVFCSVFRENSKRIRIQFFRNELVQLLWQRFTSTESEFVKHYL